MNTTQDDFPGCTERCRSIVHGDLITSAISKRSISDADLCSYLNYICNSCEKVRDSLGRTALHVAASCGRLNLVKWLIINRHANINERDQESGYTALHRSIFYGKINIAVALIKLGANISLPDLDNLTVIEHAMQDGIKPKSCFGELYTWGLNTNNSLGPHGSKSVPELLDVFHKEHPAQNVRQVVLDKFHSVIVATSGEVFSCGHGLGGRLGQGVEHAIVVPKAITFPSNHQTTPFICTQASVSRDHSIFLMTDGLLYSCGLNTHKVLGISPAPQQLLTPKQIRHPLKDIEGICTGRYHSVAWTRSAIHSWGLNAGQLGHQMVNGSSHVITPKKVKSIVSIIDCVSTSDGAIAVSTSNGDIYILHEYQCRKIASRQLGMTKVCIVGGRLDPAADKELAKETAHELKVVALTVMGHLLLWQQSDPHLCRCVFSVPRSIIVQHVTININEILFVTNYGEAFRGIFKTRRKKTEYFKPKNIFNKFLDKEECVSIKITKLPKIQRAISIVSDPKGEDFCVIQQRPFDMHISIIDKSSSRMETHLSSLLDDTSESDNIHDVIFEIGQKRFPAHRYIVSHRSEYFHKMFLNNGEIIELKDINSDIFEQLLMYFYTGTCDLLICGPCPVKLRKLCDKFVEIKENDQIKDREISNGTSAFEQYKINELVRKEEAYKNPIRLLHEMAKKFKCVDLFNILSSYDMQKYDIKKKSQKVQKPKPITLSRTNFPEFFDVVIKCSEGKEINAHKCVLASRMEYFSNMFSMRWHGENVSKVSFPFPFAIVEVLMEFLYTDILNLLEKRDWDFSLKVLVLADQYFVLSLKEQCEIILSKQLSLKNVVQILSFSHHYNAKDLKESALLFIVHNLIHFLETQSLNEVDQEIMKELTEKYFNEKPKIGCRVITPYSTAISDEDLIAIASSHPIDLTAETEKITSKNAQKRRSRAHKVSISETKITDDETCNLDSIIQFPDISEAHHNSSSKIEHEISKRLQAISTATEIIKNDEYQPEFTKLNSKRAVCDDSGFQSGSFDNFPELNRPPFQGNTIFCSKSPNKLDSKHKVFRISQKERKRLSSETKENVIIPESPNNPWKILPEVPSPSTSVLENHMNISDIMLNEKKRKENLVKIQSKLLLHTQIEDKAIVELERFYNIENVEEEIITVQRVEIGNIASPVWVPNSHSFT